MEESTAESTTPSILHTKETEDVSDVTQKPEPSEINTKDLLTKSDSLVLEKHPLMNLSCNVLTFKKIQLKLMEAVKNVHSILIQK